MSAGERFSPERLRPSPRPGPPLRSRHQVQDLMPVKYLPLPPGLKTEKAWQTLVIGYAQTKGWRVAHFRPAKIREGKWVTAVQGNAGAGFPDLVLIRETVLFRELKGEKTTVEKHQRDVMEALRAAGANVAVWRPMDWPEVQKLLSAPKLAITMHPPRDESRVRLIPVAVERA